MLEQNVTITNNKKCPVCGSDMTRDKTDSPHDLYTEHRTCRNPICGVSVTIHN